MLLSLDTPLDMHLHLRQGRMLKSVTKFSAKTFSGALVMPNTIPPITTKQQLREYKKQIECESEGMGFEPYMTLFFRSEYEQTFLKDIKDDLCAIKLYSAGQKHNRE